MQIDLAIIDVKKSLQTVIQALRHRLSLSDNLQCSIITVDDTGLANTSFTVVHKLGKTPEAYIANLDLHGTVRSVSKDTWTTTEMQIECSVAHAQLTLVVF